MTESTGVQLPRPEVFVRRLTRDENRKGLWQVAHTRFGYQRTGCAPQDAALPRLTAASTIGVQMVTPPSPLPVFSLGKLRDPLVEVVRPIGVPSRTVNCSVIFAMDKAVAIFLGTLRLRISLLASPAGWPCLLSHQGGGGPRANAASSCLQVGEGHAFPESHRHHHQIDSCRVQTCTSRGVLCFLFGNPRRTHFLVVSSFDTGR